MHSKTRAAKCCIKFPTREGKTKSSRFLSPEDARSLGGGGRERGQGGIRPCHVTGEPHTLPEPSRAWVPKGKVRIFLEHKNTRAALIILLGLSSRSTTQVGVGWGVQGWARKGGGASLHSHFTVGRQGCLSLGPCPVLSALCSKSQGTGPRGQGRSCFLNTTPVCGLSIVLGYACG